jgi:hypothetical protein
MYLAQLPGYEVVILQETPRREYMLLAEQQTQFEHNTEPSTFVRLEQKFLLPKSAWAELQHLLDRYSEPSYLEAATDFNLIESTYYDSSELKIYTDHFTNLVSRVKVRTRRYAPNGEWKHKSVFIEVKKKADGICTKERLKLPVDQCALLARGEALAISEDLTKKNKKVDAQDLCERVALINNLVQNFNLRPQARVVYQRQAYEKDGFRVTVDDNLNYELLRPIDPAVVQTVKNSEFWSRANYMRGLFDPGHVLILELKHNGVIPLWMSEFLAQNNIGRSQFSKYCFSITSSILKG